MRNRLYDKTRLSFLPAFSQKDLNEAEIRGRGSQHKINGVAIKAALWLCTGNKQRLKPSVLSLLL